jgi:DNA-binding transcriptional LysR family regulator
VPFGEIASQQCIMVRREQSPAMHDVIRSTAERAGITLDVIEELDDPCATAIAVATKPVVGFCSAPRATQVRVMPAGLGAVVVQLTDPVPTLDLHVAWRAGHNEPMVHVFLQTLRQAGPFAVPRTGRDHQGSAPVRR